MSSRDTVPRFRKRRVARIRTELGLLLSQHHGGGANYDKSQIDLGRQELGFDDLDDALVAYAFFGADLIPDFLTLNGLADFQAEIESALDSITDDASAAFFEEGAL